MNKVVTINLGGRAYQLEESGYEVLRAYLDEATKRLADDPSKDEIIADLEQAIGEKCDKTLSPHKTVVTTVEVERIIAEMGPVEGGAKQGNAGSTNTSSTNAPRRFYLIREGMWIGGVCTGLAAYFNIDVMLIRLFFVLLTVLTSGIWIALYILAMIFLPYADTEEAKAAARGEPFTTEALVQRAKERWSEGYERVTGEKWDENSDFADAMKIPAETIRSAHERHREWKKMRKAERAKWKAMRYAQRHPNPIMGFFLGVLGLMWILALISLISTGAIFGWPIPVGFPIWAAVVLLFIGYHALTGPFRGSKYYYNGNQYYPGYDAWEGFIGVLTAIFIVIAIVWAYRDVPQVYEFVHHPIATTQNFATYIKSLKQ